MEARGWAPRRRWCLPGLVPLAFAVLLRCLLTSGRARVYSRCELARALQDLGLEGCRGHSLADSAAVDHEADGSTNNGIFQINSRKWRKNFHSNEPSRCHMYCSVLPLQPHCVSTVIYAMKISQQPLGTWETWRRHCQGKDLSDWVDGCDI
ncbi:hypothetical protein MC885_019628 [Smutsia gigantea]|nr:hypothetical protein MC885_019628 [Smutsia gigantea]